MVSLDDPVPLLIAECCREELRRVPTVHEFGLRTVHQEHDGTQRLELHGAGGPPWPVLNDDVGKAPAPLQSLASRRVAGLRHPWEVVDRGPGNVVNDG
eukprot:CAMPEP_0175308590 /NCGR_PEP_ID=MMETSP0093-20121207/65369_1 /TAXON_ID=311494 /ORGANISM="Alexandrium monilatum, Strain CCMP3105" /LENGTH=97 /DNA_ID=CAMNT_0016605115 /DNA_START=641 /DNA_END=931 /DNA_ORIENTATION=-